MTDPGRQLAAGMYVAGQHVPPLIEHAVEGLGLFDDPDTVARAIAVELVGRSFDPRGLACIAAHAIVEAAKAKREFPPGRRYLTRDDRDAIADDQAHVRREDVTGG